MGCRDQTSSKDRHCWPATEVNVKSGVKGETMKKVIYLTIAFMLMLTFIGCASTTSEQRKEMYDLRQNVGSSQFVGSSKNLDAKGLMPMLAY